MTTDDAYSILEVHNKASLQDVKEAFRDLAKVWHPDRFGDSERLRRRGEEKLKMVTEAYNLLLPILEEAERQHELAEITIRLRRSFLD
ncbi:MAG TPA: molecular chaperone DnaJ, partial [Gemmatimonadetes bacterium]|nr:molecular chaperone DnaJ [Gemmatimonadota bacterium]